jgi:hypothetical protein
MKQVKKVVIMCMPKCSYAAEWTILNLFGYRFNDATSSLIA